MRYVIASSRCPFSHDVVMGRELVKENVGGVATALKRAISKHGGTWICWGDGKADNRYVNEDVGTYKIKRIILTPQEKRGYYDMYSNRTLWPLFHYFRERVQYTDNGYETYRKVNEKFAEEILNNTSQEDIVWVHDYQLSLVPGILRQKGLKNRIIFTWHIPWVSREMFETLTESDEIKESVGSADFITFHTDLYRKNFESLFENRKHGKSIAVPLGIDYRYFEKAKSSQIKSYALKDKIMLFSIDRLDYTKGLTNRVLSIERLIRNHPETSGKFVYVMIVTPSRTSVSDYVSMKRELEMNIGRVNGEFGTISWMPILYMYRKISDHSLVSYYKSADIALITPLIDGLNLVSKEFIASTEKGILVLSKFAGASNCLRGALIVNPNSPDEVADAIYKAMNMERKEADERLLKMKAIVKARDTDWWIKRIYRLAIAKEHDRRVTNNRIE
ncbi:alpha,alpha-trehalose-phosphate synthase (UDP-forming) [Thermoplasma volcanium]|nr:trehalose-6-phosphate synthase [Thermoplasma volcanium]